MPPNPMMDPAPRLTLRPHLLFWMCFAIIVLGGFVMALFATGCVSTGGRPAAPSADVIKQLRAHVHEHIVKLKNGVERRVILDCIPSKLDPATTRFIRHHRRGLGAAESATAAAPIVGRSWVYGQRLDQGSIGGCTGWGSTGVLNADPDPARPALTDKYALGVYRDAQKCDPWPGGEYPGWWWDGGHYSGSTVEAAVQVLTERGWCDGAEWATDLEAFVVGVATRGPALMGTVWMDGMSQADSEGVVHATGKNAGGHCYYIAQTVVTDAAASPIQGKALIVNSWGTGWADNGTAWISFSDLDQLFKAGGQAAFMIQKRATPAPESQEVAK